MTALLAQVDDPPLVTPFVVAEVDYLFKTRFGTKVAVTVVTAARYGTTDLLSLNEQRFRAIAPLWGEVFRLLPTDR